MEKELEKIVVTMYAETQLHAGKGMDIGVVDLPIQRERTTGFPIIQGVKGSVRANFRNELRHDEAAIFGSEFDDGVGKEGGQSNDETISSGNEVRSKERKVTLPGAIAFSEAKILLFPVRSLERLFVWVTSPLALIRFFKALEKEQFIKNIQSENIGRDEAVTTATEGEMYLEEFRVTARKAGWLKEVAEFLSENVSTVDYLKKKLKQDIVVVSDETFSNIVETLTEVVPRVSIDRQTKTVKKGALWYEEYLPQDTVMYFIARKTAYANGELLSKLENAINDKVMTIGGKETVGKGLVALKVVKEQ